MSQAVLAVIVGNRDFFPDRLVTEGRQDILALFKEMGIEPVILDENDTKLGGVETWQDAKKCAELFKANRDKIDGILVLLPNFGDEKGVADTLKLSGLNVPDPGAGLSRRPRAASRSSAAATPSAARSRSATTCASTAIRSPSPTEHTVHPPTPSVPGRPGAVRRRLPRGQGPAQRAPRRRRRAARRVQHRALQREAAAGVRHQRHHRRPLRDPRQAAQAGRRRRRGASKLAEHQGLRQDRRRAARRRWCKMAKLGVVIDDWMAANDLDATAIQCWTSIQQNYGVNACTLMSMMSEKLMPSACEVDVTGVVSMYALQLASGTPSALVDWNNNYGDDPDKCVLFHCGNWAKSFFPEASRSAPPTSSARRWARRTPTARWPAACPPGRSPSPASHRRRQRRHPRLRGRGRVHRRPAGDLRQPGRGARCPTCRS